MADLALEPTLGEIDLSKLGGPTAAKVIRIDLPKKSVAVVFGQMIGQWPQRFNTYLLNEKNQVLEPQVLWDATTAGSRFNVTDVIPPSAVPLDKNVFNIGPFDKDRKIAVYCSHKKPGDTDYKQSDPKYSFHAFQIGTKNAISFTMVNAEDGGDTNYHDTVVGVAVAFL